ncbi:gamma-butyrobetaine dioxygenase-like [Patiria miniata]|uniref:Gamma-butyrobetaine dioxygenase n=1 Tax=Patiria miniata TaxID=46514 RepID=A0A913ZKJ7_PATMI|nr:gamma-butyrobetaine dioxygenase-like [Patiria miniata]
MAFVASIHTLTRHGLVRGSVPSLRQGGAAVLRGGLEARGTKCVGQHPDRRAASLFSVFGRDWFTGVGRNLPSKVEMTAGCFKPISSIMSRKAYSTQAAPKGEKDRRFVSVNRDDSAGQYRVEFSSGPVGVYPYVWMRDNCRCPDCYHPSSWQRASSISDLDPDVVPTSEELVDEGSVLRVVWPDQHSSDFQAAWLNRQRFSESEKDEVGSPELQTWGGELNGRIPTFDFQRLLEEDKELYNWLDVLNVKGLALVNGAPIRQGALEELAEKVAYTKTTIYGKTFQVFSKQEASNLAYTPKALLLHIDLPFYNYTPGIQMLHCIEQTSDASGGASQFVDGLQVAEQVRQEFPEMYQTLRTLEVDFRDKGSDYRVYHLKKRRPIIQYNKYGEFMCVNYNDHVRAPYLSLPVEQVKEVYKAMKLFEEFMYRPGNLVEHRLGAGEIATFNNGRVLHGRSSYTVTKEGRRHLEGAYMDWDEAHSRMRILRETLFGDEPL